LHWLIHQGHVIEFANGILETAKKPVPKPPKSQAKAETQPAAAEEGIVVVPGALAETAAVEEPKPAPDEPEPSAASEGQSERVPAHPGSDTAGAAEAQGTSDFSEQPHQETPEPVSEPATDKP